MVFLGGLITSLTEWGFSFPYGRRAADGGGKEIITIITIMRLGWSQQTQEDEELTSRWALSLLVPFLEQIFHGLDRGRQTGVWGIFLLKSHSDIHTELAPYGRHLLAFLNSRPPVHEGPKVPLATEKLNLSCES